MKSKALFFFIIAGLIASANLGARVIEKTYYFDYPTITTLKGFQSFTFPNCLLSGLPGQPSLPYQEVVLLLPPGEAAKTIEFIGENETTIQGKFILFPYQPSKPLSSPGDGEIIQDLQVYKSRDLWPVEACGRLMTQYMNGFGFALSTFTPLRYLPAEGKITFYKKVNIRITTTSDEQAIAARKNFFSSPDQLTLVKQFAQNPEALADYPPVTNNSSAYQVLIISPDIFLNSFQELVNLYYIRGMKTKIVPVNTIYNTMSGVDNPEKIRNYVIQEYQAHQIRHLLLAGDIELIPYRGLYCLVNSSSVYIDNNIPADLYFSALDGNWNANGNNLWGEPGEEDLLPEISVARLSASDTIELGRMLHKTIMYQDSPVTGDLKKPLLIGEKLYDSPLTWGGNYMDLLIGQHSDNGYTTDGILPWHNYEKLYDRDLPSFWTVPDLLAKINEGHSFIHHVGHANTDYVMRMYSYQVNEAAFSSIDGTTHSFVPIYSHGCYCAQFDYSDCIAEKMLTLPNFANAFVGNSRYGWFNEGTTEGPSEHLHREFVNALYAMRESHIGQAHTISKIKAAPWVTAPGQWEEGALRWCVYDCNVLGDPAMAVWTDVPVNLQLAFPQTLVVSDTGIDISVDTNNTALAGAVCTLVRDTALMRTAATDSLGHVHFYFPAQSLDTGFIKLYVTGYNCLPDSFSIHILPASGISGSVRYKNLAASPMPGVGVALLLNGNTISQTTTDQNGNFVFTNLAQGTYTFELNCTLPWGGVNATDALQILKQFVNLISLPDFNKKAGDVDNNNVVNAIDALFVQKRFVGQISAFPAGDWLYEENTVQVAGNGDNHFIQINCLCTGDVNGSHTP